MTIYNTCTQDKYHNKQSLSIQIAYVYIIPYMVTSPLYVHVHHTIYSIPHLYMYMYIIPYMVTSPLDVLSDHQRGHSVVYMTRQCPDPLTWRDDD